MSIIRYFLFVLLFSFTGLCQAFNADEGLASPPFSGSSFSWMGMDASLSEMLSDVAATEGTIIVVDPKLDSVRLTESFKEEPTRNVWRALCLKHGLLWFYDGLVLRVTSVSDLTTIRLPNPRLGYEEIMDFILASDFRSNAFRISLVQSSNSGPQQLKLQGHPKFIEELEIFLGYRQQSESQQNELSTSPASQMDVRIFMLKYTSPLDRRGERGIGRLLSEIMHVEFDGREFDAEGQSETGNSPKITAVTHLNAVAVMDYPERMHKYEAILAKLDRPKHALAKKSLVLDIPEAVIFPNGVRYDTHSVEVGNLNSPELVRRAPKGQAAEDVMISLQLNDGAVRTVVLPDGIVGKVASTIRYKNSAPVQRLYLELPFEAESVPVRSSDRPSVGFEDFRVHAEGGVSESSSLGMVPESPQMFGKYEVEFIQPDEFVQQK